MDPDAITRYIRQTFERAETIAAMNATFFFNDPEKKFPFATLVTIDEHDAFSNLSRPDVFRLNLGVSKETFRAVTGSRPTDPTKSETGIPHDFTALDRIMPHPVYGKMGWICVLNPSEVTFKTLQPLLAEAYDLSARRYVK